MIIDRLPVTGRLWDALVVGSGPVGIALSLEFDRVGSNVLVLESGGLKNEPLLAQASKALIVDPHRHAPMEIAVRREFGGTSWLWAGRCVPFDDIDFVERPYVPHSGWPIKHEEIRRWYSKAAEYLLCGSDVFERPAPALPDAIPNVSITSHERWAYEPRLAKVYRGRLARSKHITLALHSTVVDLELEDDGAKVSGVIVVTPHGTHLVKAREVILATGGVETARLLLAVQRRWPKHFGGPEGALGRYYMGHISGTIANVVFKSAAAGAAFDFQKDGTGFYVRRRFTLTALAQRQHQLLNTAFWPDNPPLYDPDHRSGVLSAIFLALAFPPVGRRLVAEGLRVYHTGQKPHRFAAHVRNLVVGAPRSARDIAALLRERYLDRPRKPAPLLLSAEGRYALAYHGEQEPNPDSRVKLTTEIDSFGLPRVAIDLRFAEGDVRSVIESHRVLDVGLQAGGIARLEYRYAAEEFPARILARASDGYHQAGTTRMGRDPRDSVVDANLKVHGVTNLHVASSAVFPTAGQANSTFVAVALAARLANHLTTPR